MWPIAMEQPSRSQRHPMFARALDCGKPVPHRGPLSITTLPTPPTPPCHLPLCTLPEYLRSMGPSLTRPYRDSILTAHTIPALPIAGSRPASGRCMRDTINSPSSSSPGSFSHDEVWSRWAWSWCWCWCWCWWSARASERGALGSAMNNSLVARTFTLGRRGTWAGRAEE